MKGVLHFNEKAVYRIAGAGVLAGAVLLGGEGVLGTGILGMGHLLTVWAVLAVSAGLNFMAARGRILCLAGLFTLFFTGFAAAGAEESVAFLGSFWPWLTGKAAVPEAWGMGYGLVWAGVLAEGCYLAEILFEKAPTVKAAAAVLAFFAMLFCLFARKELNHYGMVFLVGFCVIAWMEWIQGRWKKERSGRGSREAHTLWVMPFLALYLVLLAVLPAPQEPYGWPWAKNIYHQLRDSLLTLTENIRWGSREGFGMAFSGFSESGELGGGLRKGSGEVMRIKTGQGFPGTFTGYLYLTGNVYDTFDGREWRQEYTGYPGDVFLDTAEALYAVRRYNRQFQRDYLQEASLEIRYEDFNTAYVFAPLKAWSIEGGKQAEEYDYENRGGFLRWAEQKGYGTEYGLRYYRMNMGQQEFDRFLETVSESGGEDGEEDEEAWPEVLLECRRRNGESFTQEDIALYRKGIYEHYLGKTELSEEAGIYLKEMTGDAGTVMEKLRAIEQALGAFSYTLSPGELPEWVDGEGDFLDYFLLESRQGYCTYFATAFVLLARAEGIPARYVQGYCVPVVKGGEAVVDSSMAHAWPELYLEGVGWIPFEPTPGSGERRDAFWSLMQEEPAQQPGEQEELQVSEEDFGEEEEIVETEEKDEEGSVQPSFWKRLWIAVPLLLAICTALLMLDCYLARYRYRKMSSFEKLRAEVARNLEILSWFGVRRREWETLQELRERVEGLPELKSAEFCFLNDYEDVVYGGAEADGDMLKRAVQAGEIFLGLLKKEKKRAYFYCRVAMVFGRHRKGICLF